MLTEENDLMLEHQKSLTNELVRVKTDLAASREEGISRQLKTRNASDYSP
jgi:hypothetical protein